MSLNRGIGSAEYMKKKIPTNAKYEHVKTKLDTGCSLTKLLEKQEEDKKYCRYRKDDIFKRLKVTTFAQLVRYAVISGIVFADGLSVVSDTDLECLSDRTPSSPQMSPLSDHHEAGDKEISSARSTLLSVISGVGELNVDRNNQKMENELASTPEPADRPYPDCPYLLLDVRDREQYDSCHIIGAHSFPVAMLTRTMNPYTKEVLEYKNAAGKIIIVYDEDERIASQAANTMCQRGFENVFMLCGGLKIIAHKFPSGMTTGSFPASCLPSTTSAKGKKSSAAQHPAEKRWRFTSDELAKIQEQMEEILIPSNSSSRMTSRMSTSSSQSKASSRQSSSAARRDGARVQSSRAWK
uniref:Centrosomal protein 41 n=1 Tax=Stegastes partitus TaxID=144197 RepID=A0A3B4YYP9_9TELE